MNPQLSVVVPTRNAARTLDACLASLRAQQGAAIELIVVDNASNDDTPAIAARYADRVLAGGPERSAQRNQGWRAATAPLVAFLDADMVAEPQLAGDAVAVVRGDARLGALVIPEESFGVGFLARCRALEKRLYLGDPAVEAARVFTRAALAATGGFDERLTAFEDWDLTDRALAAGFLLGRTQARVWHDEGRIRLRVAFAKKRYYGQWLARYRSRPDAPPPRPLTRPVLTRSWGHLASQPVRAAGLAVLKAVEAAGIAAGALAARDRAGRR